ncbi:2-isopropylmalate synthase LeuA [Butyrivibrio proteoclasticus B316]|uniref:2-isopropylmalate synthase n=1 Tax=Butyrivibrio proteoclasticus (strain ATCC 51982 / DSM 14932 / B316) TaxID=515622 RepID=E0RY33_BUTPB|nr:2-isopropylmalate synthase [Butyrivibrio proteoclasticus]ADL34988.1 2-isopropylmalate synthase LeuA [Butyrivibrio proteoclasticus B316]
MKNFEKYQRQYFMPPKASYDWVKKDYIDHPPIWCSVDLRDGNQALIEPMSLDEKLEFFTMLVNLGFKEIEIGFPAASETEFEFARTLIEKNMIPDDVTVQVLTQAREHIIRRTFEAVKGAPRAIIHLYNSTSVAQREQVFKKSKAEVKQIAVDGARLLDKLAKETTGNFSFEYSPESFPGTEVDYAVEVCNAVLDVWKPTKKNKVVINIPTTVEIAMPHVFATQVEYISKNLKYRDNVVLSLHPHNDRGTGVSDAELGCLAGADRIEGTLFGNGERTGNVDIVTLAINMYSHGVDPGLDFSHIMEIGEAYERLTRMRIYERQPYAGQLVFTAFSGSHQDAISKGFTWHDQKKDKGIWSVPYLPVDPKDLGREYDGDVIRINSQSGKGGVSYILKTNYGMMVPKEMQADVSYTIKDISDREHAELSPSRIYQIFEDKYVHNDNVFKITECHFKQIDGILTEVTISHADKEHVVEANGNGRLDAVSNAIKQYFNVSYELSTYEEHALSRGSSSKACTYVGITHNGKKYWGVGIDEDIIRSSINALVIAVNQIDEVKDIKNSKDERINSIINYIQENYLTVTLDDLSSQFYLSKPYLSKYIKEKSGMTFGENVKRIRLNKASTLLRNGNMKVEKVAEAAGYQNVEHFNRLFKKKYGMTPVQYRTSR